MSLSSFIIRLIFLALPGILSSKLYRALVGKPTTKDWEDVLEIGLFSLVIYSLYGTGIAVLNWFGWVTGFPTALQAFSDETIPIPWGEIPIACVIGVFVALIAAYGHKFNVINRIGIKLRATRWYGDSDLWDMFFERPVAGWVYVRDHKRELVYLGWVDAYSDAGKERELILNNVSVFREGEGEIEGPIYTSPWMYISRDKYEWTIETTQSTTSQPSNEDKEEIIEQRREEQAQSRSRPRGEGNNSSPTTQNRSGEAEHETANPKT
jgi:hypothetical protein